MDELDEKRTRFYIAGFEYDSGEHRIPPGFCSLSYIPAPYRKLDEHRALPGLAAILATPPELVPQCIEHGHPWYCGLCGSSGRQPDLFRIASQTSVVYEVRLAWRYQDRLGSGSWQDAAENLARLKTLADQMCDEYGPGTHWIERRPLTGQPSDVRLSLTHPDNARRIMPDRE